MLFLLDHDVPAGLAPILRNEGHDVERVPAVLGAEAADGEILRFAATRGCGGCHVQSGQFCLGGDLVAKGSCGEVRAQLRLATRIGIQSNEKGKELTEAAHEVSAMLQGLIGCRRRASLALLGVVTATAMVVAFVLL